jgi:hypothetical protein
MILGSHSEYRLRLARRANVNNWPKREVPMRCRDFHFSMVS